MKWQLIVDWFRENLVHIFLLGAAVLSAFVTRDINGVVASLFSFIAIEMFYDKTYYQKKIHAVINKKRDIVMGEEILGNTVLFNDKYSKAKEVVFIGASNTVFHRFIENAKQCLERGGNITLVYTDPNSAAIKQMADFFNRTEEDQKSRLLQSYDVTKRLLGDYCEKVEFLFSPHFFSGAYICINRSLYNGIIYHQTYLRNSFQADSSPIIVLERYEHAAIYDVYNAEVGHIISDGRLNTQQQPLSQSSSTPVNHQKHKKE